jgi:hypothetical protein
MLLFLAIVALGFAAWLWSSWARSRAPTAPAVRQPSLSARVAYSSGRA